MSEDQSNKELFAAVDFRLEVVEFLGSRIGKYLIGRAEIEREAAVKELIDTPPDNSSHIRQLQSTIKRAESIQYWMAELIQEGIAAEEQLLSQDRVEGDE